MDILDSSTAARLKAISGSSDSSSNADLIISMSTHTAALLLAKWESKGRTQG